MPSSSSDSLADMLRGMADGEQPAELDEVPAAENTPATRDEPFTPDDEVTDPEAEHEADPAADPEAAGADLAALAGAGGADAGLGAAESATHPGPSTSKPAGGRGLRTGAGPAALPSRRHGGGAKAVAVPILFTVAGLMLIPGIWAVLIMSGIEVPGSDRDAAGTMAVAMLLSWPIAICLLAAGVVLASQLAREKKRAK